MNHNIHPILRFADWTRDRRKREKKNQINKFRKGKIRNEICKKEKEI